MVEVAARILEDFLKIEGVRAALLVGRDGFVVVKAGSPPEVDPLGALSVSLLGISESIGKMSKGERLDLLSVEFDNLFCLMSNVTDELFLVVMSEPSSIGRLRYETKRIRLKLQTAL